MAVFFGGSSVLPACFPFPTSLTGSHNFLSRRPRDGFPTLPAQPAPPDYKMEPRVTSGTKAAAEVTKAQVSVLALVAQSYVTPIVQMRKLCPRGLKESAPGAWPRCGGAEAGILRSASRAPDLLALALPGRKVAQRPMQTPVVTQLGFDTSSCLTG